MVQNYSPRPANTEITKIPHVYKLKVKLIIL